MYRLTRIALTALALVVFAGSAQAALVAQAYGACGPTDGCEGSTLFLSVDDNGGSGSWLVTYTINTEYYTGDELGMNQVGFKVIQGWTSAEVITSPPGSMTNPVPYDGLVPWNPVSEAPVHANSLCEPGPGGTDKVCAAGFVNVKSVGGDYTWVFLIEGGTLITDTSEWHFGGQYADGRLLSPGHIISTDGGAQPVPEPTAAVLFGLGALLVTRSVRRR
jgi:hypothetical protein